MRIVVLDGRALLLTNKNKGISFLLSKGQKKSWASPRLQSSGRRNRTFSNPSELEPSMIPPIPRDWCFPLAIAPRPGYWSATIESASTAVDYLDFLLQCLDPLSSWVFDPRTQHSRRPPPYLLIQGANTWLLRLGKDDATFRSEILSRIEDPILLLDWTHLGALADQWQVLYLSPASQSSHSWTSLPPADHVSRGTTDSTM